MENQSRPATGYPASAYPHPPPPPNTYPNSAAATAATAYPYAAPPPPHPTYYYPNNNPHYPQPYPDPRATFARRLFVILIASFLIALTVALALWLILRPRLPDFRVDSLALSNLNLSSSSITANWAINFTVVNPNKKITFYYDQVQAAVYYNDVSLSETTVPPFVQPTRNQTPVRATFAAAGAYVDKSVVEGINGSRGSVNFNVRVLARVRLKAGWWRARQRLLRVYCGDLAVGMNSSSSAGGTLVGGPKECRVAL